MAGGRPSKLTPEVKEKLINAIKMGNYYEAACAYAGIEYSTFRKWMIKGEKSKNGEFFEFFKAIKQAEAEAEARIVALWQKQIPDNWQAARDFLERRYPDRWGKRERVQMEHSGEMTQVIKDDGATERILANIRETIEATFGRTGQTNRGEGNSENN
jgi:transposase-like protein